MFYLYVLRSLKDESFYIGYSSDVYNRLFRHNDGDNPSTRANKPWKLIYFEAFASKKDAMERERKLKNHGKGFQELKKRLVNSF